MISCTEFIPAYSELFSYLDETHGREEVNTFWKYLFEPSGSGIPLVNFVKKEGIRGCFSYWSGTLNEEAADFTMYLNEKAGWFQLVMHHCPSKGRLLELQKEIGVKPFRDYCLHCDSYRSAVAQIGLKYIYNFTGVDHAACSILIYDPKVFDGRVIVDSSTEIMERKASDNEYFHRDFHSSLNRGAEYLGEKYGPEELRAYLVRYTNNVYCKLIEQARKDGLGAIAEKIRDTYRREKAEDVLTLTCTEDRLDVAVSECPAVRHLHATGRTVSKWYRYTTEYVMQALADACGFRFTMDAYDEASGAASYHFTK